MVRVCICVSRFSLLFIAKTFLHVTLLDKIDNAFKILWVRKKCNFADARHFSLNDCTTEQTSFCNKYSFKVWRFVCVCISTCICVRLFVFVDDELRFFAMLLEYKCFLLFVNWYVLVFRVRVCIVIRSIFHWTTKIVVFCDLTLTKTYNNLSSGPEQKSKPIWGYG